ncbi:N-acetyl sugar amidotransferase [Candidatus Micrarchaeota archaeon]|nr:N-acetyl sugar amidotransferase [Candidatus Micrarchaeota archaeon]
MDEKRGSGPRQTCVRCVYDTTIPRTTFDDRGVCNYCAMHDQMDREYPTGEAGWKKLVELAERIKASGKNNKYDCVIGVSGGCDSSYLLYLAKVKLGLRPLAVHFDNTWNSRIAVENIHRVLRKLDIDLYTYVMDNDEFNDLVRAFLKASVPEADCVTDIGLITTLYEAADKHHVKYILDGHSFRTEGFAPLGWFYFDGKYVESVHKRYGTMKIKHYPNLWLSKWMKWLLKGIKRARPLYYVDYQKEETKTFLSKEFGWQWYGGHHMENRYTIFGDNLILAGKFGRDLRYTELAAMVRSGQLSREAALEELKTPVPYDDEVTEEVKKRLNLSDEEFEEILRAPHRTHKDFETYHPTFRMLRPLFWLMYKTELVPKSFYIKYTRPAT